MNMLHSLRIATLAAVMLFAAMLPGRAEPQRWTIPQGFWPA